ncbi:MAG: hypothetical protein ACRBCJ_00065 [Hyphomicrobiaceae bacterium]
MQGQITKFREDINMGVIVAKNGNKYRFSKTQVLNLNGRLVGHEVDFIADRKQPKDIILLTGTAWTVFAEKNAA